MSDDNKDKKNSLAKAQDREEAALRALFTKEILTRIEKRLMDDDPDVMKALKAIMDDNYKKRKKD